MRALYERVETLPAASWSWYVCGAPQFTCGWHFHPEVELTLITAGTGQRLVGDSIESYAPGDLTLIGSELPHAYVSDVAEGNGSQEAVVAQFGTDFLGAAFFDRPEFEQIATLLHRAERGVVFTGNAAARAGVDFRSFGTLDQAPRTIALLELLLVLASAEAAPRSLASAQFHPPLDRAAHARLNDVCQYLASSYAGKLSLSQVADVAHMSPAAFSRFFHRTMGHTVTAHLIELRIASACRLLIDTDLPIADVAARSGHQNLSNFNRRFRYAKQMSPREYRATFRDGDSST